MRNRVRELRLGAGLTQQQLADRCGMPYATLARIDLNPRASIALDKAGPIAKALGVEPLELVPAKSR